MTRLHRLKVKVTLQSHEIYPSLRVCSISLEHFERFSLIYTQMFLSVSWCSEPMTQLRRLKVKVTLQGHGIYPRILCPSNLLNLLLDFIKHHANIPLNELVCRTNDSTMQTLSITLQGHWILRRWIWLSFRLLSCCCCFLSSNMCLWRVIYALKEIFPLRTHTI